MDGRSEKYREYLIESVRTAGKMVIEMAEDIVGTTDCISDLNISIDFDPEGRSIPEVTFTRSHFPVFEKLEKLNNIWRAKYEQ